jgi:hypothetical protein
MKKLTVTIVCALAFTGMAFAQGSVFWGGITPAAMTAQTNTAISALFGGPSSGGVVGYTAVTAGGFYYELLYNTSFTGSQAAKPTTLTALSTWLDTGLGATNATYVTAAGKLIPIAGTSQATVPWAAGVTNNIMLVGWSANLGTTWSDAFDTLQNWDSAPVYGNAFFGMSNTGYINPHTEGTDPGAILFGAAPTGRGLPINSLNTQLYLVVPEPGTMALAGLSGFVLLMFRRRKAS